MTGASAKSTASAALRPQLLLEHQLDDVGERLQQSLRARPGRAEALLQQRGHLALDLHHTAADSSRGDEDDQSVRHDLGDEQRVMQHGRDIERA